MSSLIIKIVALVSMTIDHIGFAIFDNNIYLRFIGMMAFPLYGFLLMKGFSHTKTSNKRLFKYLISIFLLAIISEPLYDKLFYGTYYTMYSQNALFSLLISLMCMIIYDRASSKFYKVLSVFVAIYIAFISEFLHVFYGAFGILLIFSYYLINNSNIKSKYKYLLYLLSDILYIIILYFITKGNLIYLGIILSLIPIILCNDKKGYNSKLIKYFFYLYYPLELLILVLLKMWKYVNLYIKTLSLFLFVL